MITHLVIIRYISSRTLDINIFKARNANSTKVLEPIGCTSKGALIVIIGYWYSVQSLLLYILLRYQLLISNNQQVKRYFVSRCIIGMKCLPVLGALAKALTPSFSTNSLSLLLDFLVLWQAWLISSTCTS